VVTLSTSEGLLLLSGQVISKFGMTHVFYGQGDRSLGSQYQRSEETVGFDIVRKGWRVADSRRKEEGTCRPCRAAIAKNQSPQTWNGDQGRAGTIPQLTQKSAGSHIESADVSIAEVADKQRIAEGAKVGGSDCQSPGGVKRGLCASRRAAGCEAAQEIAIRVEDIDKAAADPCDIVMLLRVLPGVGNEKSPTDILYAERRETGRKIRIRERAGQNDGGEVLVEHIDRTCSKICRKEEVAGRIGADRQPFIDGSGGRSRDAGPVYLQLCVSAPAGIPGGDRAILGRENEERRLTTREGEVRSAVKDLSRNRSSRGRGGRRDVYDQRLLDAAASIQRRLPCTVVRDPERAGRAGGDAPGIDQVRIGNGRSAGDIGDQIRLCEPCRSCRSDLSCIIIAAAGHQQE
jgi:hypothetical protein